MKRNELKTVVLLVCTALASCRHRSAEEPAPPPGPEVEQTPISLTAGSTAATRSTSQLNLIHEEFGVVARKFMADGSHQLVMGKAGGKSYKVQFFKTVDNQGYWSYDINDQFLKYWDGSAKRYLFSAFAPYSDVPVVTEEGNVEINGIRGGVKEAEDWLVCKYSRDNSAATPGDTDLLDATVSVPQPAKLTDEVPLVFHHILSQVKFKIYSPDGDIKNVTDVNVSLTDSKIYTKGNYSTSGGLNGFTGLTEPAAVIYSGAPAETSKEGSTTPENALTLFELTELPQRLPEGCKVKIDLVINGETISAVLDFYNATHEWLADNSYVYYLRLNLATDNIILVNVEVEQWQYGGETKENKLPDW